MRILAIVTLIVLMVCANGVSQSSGQWGICEFNSKAVLDRYIPSGAWDCKIAYLSTTHERFVWDGSKWKNSESSELGSLGQNIYTIDGTLRSHRYIGLGVMKLTIDGSDDNDIVFFPKNTGQPNVAIYDRNGSIGGVRGNNYFAAGLMIGRPNGEGLYIDKNEITVNNINGPDDFTIGAHHGNVRIWYKDNFAVVSLENQRFFNVSNQGRLIFDRYGRGNIGSAAPTRGAGFDAVGNVVEVPVVYAAGKVNANGSVASIYNARVSKISSNNAGSYNDNDHRGDYEIIFTIPLPDDKYIIQLTMQDCGGQCKRGGRTYDDPGITYYDQTNRGFKVNIGDNDNDEISRADFDSEFMFTVIRF
jgi:hypothetical protein